LIVVPGPASAHLGRRIGELLKARVVPIEFKRFADGESYIRFGDEVNNEDVVIVQTTCPPQNENLIQLLLMVDNARDMKARSITAVVPYLAYARQDDRFRPGEAFSVRTIMTLLKTCGVGKILTVNSHNPRLLRTMPVTVEDLSAFSLLAEHFKNKGLEGAFSASLGKKGMDVAVEADKVLKGGCDYVSTQRDRLTGEVAIEKKTFPVRNRDVVVFDDVMSSGKSMAKAVSWIKEQGAKRVYVACVHVILIGDGKDRVLKSGAESIVGTDTVPGALSEVSIAPLIADALKK
jgi:ribose-phosphate pyrophosphokinase